VEVNEQYRLRRVDLAEPGIRRVRRGRGFQYLAPGELTIQDGHELARLRALAVPAAWTDVWICTDTHGHIQAVGTDAAGRRQYLYHESWRKSRDQEKFERVLRLARLLPDVRQEVAGQLRDRGLSRSRVLAGALRMLELGAFRVGGDEYAPGDDDSDGSFGLATLRREHVRRLRGEVHIGYPAKGGQWRELSLRDAQVHRLVGELLRRGRRSGTEDLLVYRNGRSWHDVRAEDLNA
jgi:DNA topoisomerase IB